MKTATLTARIHALGFLVRLRETVFHAMQRYASRTGLVLNAFDPDDDDTKAAIEEAVTKATEKLSAKRDELIRENRTLKSKKGGEVDPAEVERLESKVDELTAQLGQSAKDLATATKAAKTATESLAAEQAHTQKLLIENGLSAALAENGVKDPAYVKAAAALIRDQLKPAVVMDGENRVAKVGDKLLGDAVKEWAAGAEGKAFVAAPAHSGGGAAGGDGSHKPLANMGGSPAERAAALKAAHPELA